VDPRLAARVRADPGCKRALVEVTGGQGEHRQCRLCLRRLQAMSVQRQEQSHAEKPGALVAIDERMIPDESCAVRRREIAKSGSPYATQVLRTGKRRFQQAPRRASRGCHRVPPGSRRAAVRARGDRSTATSLGKLV
jgi:hypothetical protein